MLDLSTQIGRILKAALDLAATRPWREVTLADIAEEAHVPLADLRDHVSTKSDLLAKLLRTIDGEVLRQAGKSSADLSKRDALFEVVMTRLDLLQPYKPALQSIYASGGADFSLAAPYLASQHWMLQAAGIGTEGLSGGARVAGLALAYASVFRTWLDDEDPGMGKTMAALDRHLRRGESALGNLEKAGSFLGRFGKALGEAARATAKAAAERRSPPDPAPAPASPAPSGMEPAPATPPYGAPSAPQPPEPPAQGADKPAS